MQIAKPISGLSQKELDRIASLRAWATSLPDDTPLPPYAASEFLRAHGVKHAPSTLARFRCHSTTGPKFSKRGRDIRYLCKDLRAYATAE